MYESLNFRYSLGKPTKIRLRGNKLTDPNIVVRQIKIMPSTKGAKKYWLVVEVSHLEDLHLVGEIMIDVKPSSAIHHETFVTVESGIRSGQIGSERVAVRSSLEKSHTQAIATVRKRLLEDWAEVLQNPRPSKRLIRLVASDLAHARTELRVDAKDRVFSSVDFLDSFGRHNPMANAARLTAALSRLRLQIEADVLNRYSLHYRFLNCMVVAENIAADIWDIQVMAHWSPRLLSDEIAKRLDRMAIKPYFWAVTWIKNNIQAGRFGQPNNAMFIAQLLATEQRLGEIDMLLSEFKRASHNDKKLLLKLITLSISSFPTTSMPLDYLNLFEKLRKKAYRLAISNSKTEDQYRVVADAIQDLIRYRASTNPSHCWYIPGSHRLIVKI